MPFKDLGLMVIDEEHENTYKSSQTPRYDTIDLANLFLIKQVQDLFLEVRLQA